MVRRVYTGLTGVRFFLAFWVLTRHWFFAYAAGGALFAWGRARFFDVGYLGVDGFFILSGFVLAHNYIGRLGSTTSYRRFVTARLARVFPVHVAMLGLLACLVAAKALMPGDGAIDPRYSLAGLGLSLLLVQSWFGEAGVWNDVAWSVSAEWFAYLFFPVFLFVTRVGGRQAAWVKAAICVGGIAGVEIIGREAHLSQPGGLLRIIPEFALGVLLCRVRMVDGRAVRSPALLVGSLAALCLGVVSGFDTLAVLGLGLLVLSLSYAGEPASAFLRWPAVVFLGEASYSIYMVQRIPEALLRAYRRSALYLGPAAEWIELIALAIGTVGLGVFFFLVVEKPLRRFIVLRVAEGNSANGACVGDQVDAVRGSAAEAR